MLRDESPQFSESPVRKAVYNKVSRSQSIPKPWQTLIHFTFSPKKLRKYWPDDWITTETLSREYSAFKRKVDRPTFQVSMPIAGITVKGDPFAKTKYTPREKKEGQSEPNKSNGGPSKLPKPG